VGDLERFKKLLSYDILSDNRYHLNNFQLCIYKAIDSMFEPFTIHAKEKATTILLGFSYKEFLTIPPPYIFKKREFNNTQGLVYAPTAAQEKQLRIPSIPVFLIRLQS
jgi:hypothetical protein